MKTLRDMLVGAVLTFSAMFSVSAFATLVLPGVQGPSLGDQNTNIYTITQAINLLNQAGFSAAQTSGVANAQATCLNLSNPLNQITSNVSTGSVCLPAAIAGRIVFITNTTANQINLFGSNTPQTVGTQDTINGTAGSTANTTVLPAAATNKVSICISPANGAWNCTVAA